jgi:hypothetical protein
MSVRLIFAGLFILIGVLGEMFFVDRMYPDINPFEGKLFGPWIVVLVAAAYFLFHERSSWVKRDGVLTYRRRDELISDIYHARRSLELRDLGTNDGWYLIELDTGKVLCLWDNLPSGPLGFDPANPEVRRFPCTEFTVSRHAVEGFTVEVVCAGQVIKPVSVSLPNHYDDWLYTYLPKDGDFIPDRTFDEVKAEVVKASGGLTSLKVS